MAASVEHLHLLDAEDNEEYTIIISLKDAEKARNDMNFATILLQEAKKQQDNKQTSSNNMELSNTSSLIHYASSNESNSCEPTEGMHIWIKPCYYYIYTASIKINSIAEKVLSSSTGIK
ncbi:uncharacterized protein LOC112588078 isoform X2 [Harpegnathos saltator]|uniref:uncharacterized protein LOC112588078 isoform X2 n=1 Tax=Harpegnathos saltator TaxID=610380 RepID=UPI000DBEDC78|nr:uncharacterized protein LOC112588078 isoform X2 [Harpegnathos saltator]